MSVEATAEHRWLEQLVGEWTSEMVVHRLDDDEPMDLRRRAGRERKGADAGRQGPSFADPAKTTKYKDTIEFLTPDHRTFSSRYLADDGTWTHFMTAHYRRKS